MSIGSLPGKSESRNLSRDDLRRERLVVLSAALRPVLHLVSITRFPSFRTQPLENLSVDSVTNGFLSNPAPGENLESGNLVMETGCTPRLSSDCAPGSATERRTSGGTTCLTLLVQHVFSSKVLNNAAGYGDP